jgi:hypothetical protein
VNPRLRQALPQALQEGKEVRSLPSCDHPVAALEARGFLRVPDPVRTARARVLPSVDDDGKELFYLATDGKLMAVDIKPSASSFQAGAPHPLFNTGIAGNHGGDELGCRAATVTSVGRTGLM